MRGLDTNILVYAYDSACKQYRIASNLLKNLAEGFVPWALPWPCIYEYLRVVTHPRITHVPADPSQAWNNMVSLLQSPSLLLLSETDRHGEVLGSLLKRSHISGNLVHDAHIAVLLLEHGVREIITADDDFRRFGELTVVNPFTGMS